MIDFAALVRSAPAHTLRRAREFSDEKLEKSKEYLKGELPNLGVDPKGVCFAVPGSIGRREALEASDCDLLVISATAETSQKLEVTYPKLREGLKEALGGLEVSSGRSVMGRVDLDSLTDHEKMGGDSDDRHALTRRVVILTEAAGAGGALDLREVRRKILAAYTERSAGPHPLGFCNDVARYYRQLCMDYKRKHGVEKADWAEHNVKLRHSRKFWYFSTMLGIASVVERHHFEDQRLVEGLLEVFETSPVERLVKAAPAGNATVSELLEHYSWYLEFLSDPARREQLNAVDHGTRYQTGPYAALQWNSKVMHSLMLNLLDQTTPGVRKRVLDWFLL